MNVTLVGGWHTSEAKNKAWKLALDNSRRDELKQFCVDLGRSLARRRHTVFVGSDDREMSADYHVVQGMLQQLSQQGGPADRFESFKKSNPTRISIPTSRETGA